MFDKERSMEQILNEYYENNASKLRKIVNAILQRFGGLSDKDFDDFYSLANEVFVDVLKRYDESGQSFDTFLYCCLCNKIKTEMTKRNRERRKADRMSVPIDTPIGTDGKSTLADMIASNIDIEKEVLDSVSDVEDEIIERYLASLSKIQRKIIEMKMQDIEVIRIKKVLNLTDKQYSSHMRQAVQYEHIKLLHIF